MRRIFTLIALVLLLSAGSGVLAQEAPTVFCGNLAQADCDLLTQSHTTMQTVDSGNASFNLNVNLSGIPDAPDNMNFSITGTGAFAGSGALNSLSDMGTDPAAMEFGTMLPALLSALETFSGEISLVVNIPPELAEDIPATIPLNLRLVNGVGYIDFDALQPITNDPSLTGWGGLDFVSLVRDLLAQQPDLFDQLTDMSSMSMGGMDTEMMMQFNDPSFLARFLSIQRAVDEGGSAVFETTIDFNALMSDPELQDTIREQITDQAAMQGETMTQEEIDMALEISTQMFENSTFTVREVIDPATGYKRSTSVSMVLDMSSLAELAEEQGESMDAAPIIAFDFSVSLDNHNSTAAINAPENASLFPYQMLLGMAGSMSEGPLVEVTPEVTE